MQVVWSILMVTGLLYCFFVCGFLFIETFYPELPGIQKASLYMVCSVVLSTYLIYGLSLVFGFSRETVFLGYLLISGWLVWYLARGKRIKIRIDHKGAVILAVLAYGVFFAALYPAIVREYKDFYVLSAVNWQDTAMHLGIIESLVEGNFPPQAPYYAGKELSYYYFSDYHSAILNVPWGEYFPRVLVYDNPFFAMMFVLAVYALTWEITRSRGASLVAAYLGVFNGNMMFVKFFRDLVSEERTGGIIKGFIELVANRGYTMEYGELMQMVPMADYFLQNRPMMIGLPTVAAIILLVIGGRKQEKRFLLAGLLGALMIKFQLFAFVVGGVVIYFGSLVSLRNEGIKKGLSCFAAGVAPILVAGLVHLISGSGTESEVGMFLREFKLGPWEEGREWWWHALFIISNFGVIAALSLVIFPILEWRKLLKEKKRLFLYLLGLLFVVLPLICRFTQYGYDMLKFYYFALIPMVVTGAVVIEKGTRRRAGMFLVGAIIIAATLTSWLTVLWSALNKAQGYSRNDMGVGLWIRENTPQRSMFLAMPTVHSPITQIGGRLRVLSYITWPYSHGFKYGDDDNVFRRLEEIENFYEGEGSDILARYKVDYVYWGSEERDKFPQSEYVLGGMDELVLVYDGGESRVYRVVRRGGV